MAVTLTLHHYYGGRQFFDEVLREPLMNFEAAGNRWVQLSTYSGLYGFGWWVSARVLGYVVMPLVVWKVFFPRDSVLDMGLRTGGFMSHLWLYGLSLAAVFAAMAVVARQPDFLEYYPFYKTASRSWFDLLCWEGMYFVQFFALEFYFRGFILAALRRTMGSAAIFVMALPYCMIHFGKPYLEAHGAIVAGVVLGSLSMRTRSIYAGFLVHITVAGLMDYFALDSRHAMPTSFWP
jgi:membrane protease YdiL (CAAX protease family)